MADEHHAKATENHVEGVPIAMKAKGEGRVSPISKRFSERGDDQLE